MLKEISIIVYYVINRKLGAGTLPHPSITAENCSKNNLGIKDLMPENIYFCVKRALEIVYNFIFKL
jgi:hypothetical protein